MVGFAGAFKQSGVIGRHGKEIQKAGSATRQRRAEQQAQAAQRSQNGIRGGSQK